MAIHFVSVKCPDCGAELSIDDSREFAFCSYCGAKVMVHNDNEHIYRNIDEARIKEAETERILRLRELELEEKENNRGRKTTLIAYGVALAFVLIGAIICIFAPVGGMCGIMIGAYIAMFTYIKSDDRKKKRSKYVSPNDATITAQMLYCLGKNYNSVAMIFRSAGFTNVNLLPLGDIGLFNQRRNGQVETITINGNGEFEEGDIFPKNANILITYHSK
ncbi:zinc ribbon domain-containing protein [Butyrivibrio sp. FCS014]|uniref:zinc ribbon domain-containing protein n=1 Tax=Butyrivibrio sp. FCS014 TaxID=1408304 RepID=UPI0004633DB6|nr:zinc ribbon domain-containing protein [Butyrivibrio sp. FCS014]